MLQVGSCYWRFKGNREYRYGWAQPIPHTNLWRMGLYNGDHTHGPIVDPNDIEVVENQP